MSNTDMPSGNGGQEVGDPHLKKAVVLTDLPTYLPDEPTRREETT